MKTIFLTAAFAAVLLGAAVTAQQCPSNWTIAGESCYKWFNEPHYWFDAEQVCLSQQAHLVSIGSEYEDKLVRRLARGGDAWIGRFGTSTAGVNSSSAYAWTDGSDAGRYHNHNFDQLDSIHKLVVRTSENRWINSLYQERYPFVCKRNYNSTLRCPRGWSLFNDHCYLMPEFESSFNQANFYCQNRSSHLVSVLKQSELEFVNELQISSESTDNITISENDPVTNVWLGLIKLNPCYPDSGGRELCYQWTDFSGKHQGFPMWQSGHPNISDWTVNCVTLRNDSLHSEACYNRHRFVCKSIARNGTDGGGPGSAVNGVVAVFDFRKGLENLVNPNTYIVNETIGIPRSIKYGSCFSKGYAVFYRVGDSVHYNKTFLSNSQWTIFMRIKIEALYSEINITSVGHDAHRRPSFWVEISNSDIYYTTVLLNEFQYQQKGSNAVRHSNSYRFSGNMCYQRLCNIAISTNNYQSVITINEEHAQANYYATIEAFSWPNSTSIYLGNTNYLSRTPFCLSCFGIANKQLKSEELKGVYKAYCPS